MCAHLPILWARLTFVDYMDIRTGFAGAAMTAEYVSMHHRIRRDLRKRLKHAAAEVERPVTDIVNEAIEEWLNSRTAPGVASLAAEIEGASVLEMVEWLRDRKADGRAFASAASLPKGDLISILGHFGERGDHRMSGDRLVSGVVRLL